MRQIQKEQEKNISRNLGTLMTPPSHLPLSRYQDDTMINYAPWASVSVGPNRTVLSVARAGFERAGNFTCAPSPLAADAVAIRVIDEEGRRSPAAVASDANGESRRGTPLALVATMLLLVFVNRSGSSAFFSASPIDRLLS